MDPSEPLGASALLSEQRQRCRRGQPFRAEDLVTVYPALRDDTDALLDVIYNEVVLREGRGESPTLTELQDRFPDLAGPLRDLFEVHAALDADFDDSDPPELSVRPSPRTAVETNGPVLEGYTVTGELGRGGMGVVYRARDIRRGVDVAVKMMQYVDAAMLYRFKQEFRTLRDVSHPNLVTLHELVSDGHSWFIVMEYVDGCDFLDYVRGTSTCPAPGESSVWVLPVDDGDKDAPALNPLHGHGPLSAGGLERLRAALRQLAEGLAVIHGGGKLHRDIKPSNVLVSNDGRVVLMDFGLATEQARAGREASTEGQMVGSAGYMAPEQAAGRRPLPAGDWYSVGVMLYEALTGRLPFEGTALDVLMDKQQFDPPPPSRLEPGVPEDLDALCVELLRRGPGERPSGADVIRRLGAGRTAPAVPAAPSADMAFVGRTAQREALDDALDSLGRNRAVLVLLSGRSGVGKSALVETFLAGTAARRKAVVLAGRCYERETVPYKALDSLIDALVRYLRHLPDPEVREILPRDAAALARVFPVLRRVDAVVCSPQRAAEVPDPQELRRRAFGALRELLARLGDRCPLVLAIDDLQWSDLDSLAVLSEILRPPDPPVLMLLGCYRSDAAGPNSVLPAVKAWAGTAEIDRREIEVGPLPADEALELARLCLGDAVPDPRRVEAVASESGGNPFFLAELARAAHAGDPSRDAGEPLTLDGVLWSRVRGLPGAARRLLQVVAVAGSPLPPALAWACAECEGDERATVARLCAARLLRTAGGDSEQVETYHDRVRETVVAHLDPTTLSGHHGRLALALEATGTADPEVLGVHFLGAGETSRACGHFAAAAGRAAETLAFDRAAALYRLALDLGGPNRDALRTALGDALANAGRGAEAAGVYLEAADAGTADNSLELRRRAAVQLLISGHIDRGLETLRDVLKSVGMTLPKTPRRALLSLLLGRARLWARGLGFRPRAACEVPPTELTRVDVCWSAAIGLSNVDWVRGADFQARGLVLALRAGEPSRVARAMAVEAAQTATAGLPARRGTARLLERAAALAGESGQPYPAGMVALAEGVSSYLEGRWRDALAACDRAEAVFRDRCNGVAWELDTAHAYSLWSLSHLGEWDELARRYPLLIDEAQSRGDLYAAMNLSTYILSIVKLAADEPVAAREETGRVLGRWSRDGYHVQHNDLVWALVQIDLYAGDDESAWDRVNRHWPTLARSLLLRVQFIRVAMLGLRARCALAASGRDPALLRRSGQDAARLGRERHPWADAQASLILAAVASQRGRQDAAARHLAAAGSVFRRLDMGLCAAAADRRLGEMTPGPEGTELVARADAWMTARTIRRPDRIAEVYAPGFRVRASV